MVGIDPKTIKDYGPFIIGVAGFAFGTYQYFDKKSSKKLRLNVIMRNGVLTFVNNHISDPVLILKISNTGGSEVIINTPGIQVKHTDGGSLFTNFGSDQAFPYTLKPGDSIHAWTDIKSIGESLKKHSLEGKVKLSGFFKTQVGKEYKAKPYFLDVDNWSEN